MLTYLKIKNMALIKSAEVEFGDGFNAITGESGAGKSILLETVSLLLGMRADKSLIRQGEDRCEISGGVLLVPGRLPEVDDLLAELAVEREPSGELRLRRVMTKTGSRCYVNDTPVNLQTLAALGAMLMDVYSANEQYTLFDRSRQLALLDRFGKLHSEVAACRAVYEKLQRLAAEREELFRELPSGAEAELLASMHAEISAASPEPGEDEKVNAKFMLAANSREILAKSAMLCGLLTDGENSTAEMLSAAYRALEDLNHLAGDELAELLENCAATVEQVRELAVSVRRFADKTELDEEALASLESRLALLQKLKRRYGPTLEDVLRRDEEAEKRLAALRNVNATADRLNAKEKQLRAELAAASEVLSGKRKAAAEKFAKATEALLARLGLPHARLEIRIARGVCTAAGADIPEFLFSANKGMEVQPLRLMASSGELSRVMLAVKSVLAGNDSTPVLIFDEIDSNIGGETALEVASAITELAKSRQVLCITHLAQVAAAAKLHFAVTKAETGEKTESAITLLEGKARARELARMLGGGGGAPAHAEQLLREAAAQR